MKTNKYVRAPAVALAGLLVAYGCTKKEADVPTPFSGTTQAGPDAPALVQARQAWARFVGDVEAGRVRDRTGQYVSKATQVANGDGTAARPTRAKFDAAQLATGAAAGGAAREGVKGAGSGGGGVANYLYPAPEDPICDGCPGGGGGGGYYPPPVSSTFVSSEGLDMGVNPTDNPNNALMDVIAITGRSASIMPGGTWQGGGYTKLNADLNRGCGGKYIYMCFTRRSLGGCDSPTFDLHRPITRIWNNGDPGDLNNGTTTQAWWREILEPAGVGNSNNQICYSMDFNDGAGGPYISMYFSKLTNGERGFSLPTPSPIKEIGILSGNSSSITPPAGWVKNYQDLNEGVGGDFIYLCYKY